MALGAVSTLRFRRGPGQQQPGPFFQLRRFDITSQACYVHEPGAYSLIISLIMSSPGVTVAGAEPRSLVVGKFNQTLHVWVWATRPRSRPGLDPPSICELALPPTGIDQP